jgi:hypothetical protein
LAEKKRRDEEYKARQE